MAESETTNDAQRELRRKCMTLDTARQLLRGDNPHHDTAGTVGDEADRALSEARLDWTHAAGMLREAVHAGTIKEQPDDGASDGLAHAPNDAAEKRRRQRMSIEQARAILRRDDPTTEAPSVNDVDSDVMARQDWFFAQWLVGSTVEGKVWPDDDRQRLAEHRMGVRSGFTVEEAREIMAGPDPHDINSGGRSIDWGYELTEWCHDWVRATNIVADDAAGDEPPTNLAGVPGAAEALGVKLVVDPAEGTDRQVTTEPPAKPKRARHVGTWMIEWRKRNGPEEGGGWWEHWRLCVTDDASPPVTSLDTAARWIKKHGEVSCQYRVIIEKRIYTPTLERSETVSLA